MQLKAGDRVITGKYTALEVKIDGEEYPSFVSPTFWQSLSNLSFSLYFLIFGIVR